MKIQQLIEWIVVVSQIPASLVAIVYPIYRVFAGRTLISSALLMWLYLALWGLAYCFIFPGLLYWLFHDKQVWALFPEGPGAAAMLFGGWLPAGALCGTAMLVKWVWRIATRHFKSVDI